MNGIGVRFDSQRLAEICRRWQISQLGLFGSVLGEDFRPDSDVDVVVTFRPGAPWSLFEMVDIRVELADLFGRPVDLVEGSAIRNPYRRRSILETQRVIYEASQD